MATCPTCGDEFDTSNGMKIHHTRSHNKSIAGKLYECKNCGKEFKDKPNRDRTFCSHDCKGEWQSENLVGEDNPLYDRECVECNWCGEDVLKKPSCVMEHNFCNEQCEGDWRSENQSGENHPDWIDGRSKEKPYLRAEWRKFRSSMSDKLDTSCSNCGDNSGRANALHHIVKVREFDTMEDANFEENVTFLCQSCHGKFERESAEWQLSRLDETNLTKSVDELRPK